MKNKQRNIRRLAIFVISQVSIEGVLIAFVIWTFVIDIVKSPYFFITWKIMMEWTFNNT